MSRKELDRVGVMARVSSRDLRLVQAAALLGLSYRQAKRLGKRYREQGALGLKHGNVGRRSHNAVAPEKREEALRLVREHYGGGVGERFGPTLAAEHLELEHGCRVHAETLRRWMLAVGLWSQVRQRKPYRTKREAKAHFGELVQLDGSHHLWWEERGPKGCLMNLVDDATATAEMGMEKEETIWGAVRVLRRWIERYGVPLALYVDGKNIYVRPATAQERNTGEPPLTQFGRMCAQLGIRIIVAGSPQAKGRVERAHGTHQDRLVKKLRVKNITTCEETNQYLESQYMEEHNRKYARPPAQTGDYHRPAPSAEQLDRIFRLQQERVIGQDWVVRYENRWFQLQRQSGHYAPARGRVQVYEDINGKITIEYRGRELKWKEIAAPVKQPAQPVLATAAPTVKMPLRRGKTIPAADHPWRRYADKGKLSPVGEQKSSLSATPSSAPPYGLRSGTESPTENQGAREPNV
jgi:transposase